MDQTLLFWMIACVLFTLLEAFTQQFVSIWFLSGSIVAMISSLFGLTLEGQFILFVLVSLVTLISLRPFVSRLAKGNIVATNTDSNLGQMAIVTREFDEITLEGRILVNDMDWSAKSIDGIAFQKGDKVLVEKIEGVKCLVRKA